MNPFSSPLGKEYPSFFPSTALSIGPDSHYGKIHSHGMNSDIFRNQGKVKIRPIYRGGKDRTKNFLTEIGSKLVFTTPRKRAKGSHCLKGVGLFNGERCKSSGNPLQRKVMFSSSR